MRISDVIKNITEIQNPNWAKLLHQNDIDSIENNFWLIWLKLKQIKEQEIIEPLLKISNILTLKENRDGRIILKNKKVDFINFYIIAIGLIPKKKYTFLNPKRKKTKNYDYQFLKLLAQDLNESIRHCEEYYDILEDVGELDNERIKLFKKYGVELNTKKTNKNILDIFDQTHGQTQFQSLKDKINNYKSLKKEILKLGYKERKKALNGLSMREYLYQKTKISQTQFYQLEFIQNNDVNLYNKVLEGYSSVTKAYSLLKKSGSTEINATNKKLRILKKEVEKLRSIVEKDRIIKIINDIYD